MSWLREAVITVPILGNSSAEKRAPLCELSSTWHPHWMSPHRRLSGKSNWQHARVSSFSWLAPNECVQRISVDVRVITKRGDEGVVSVKKSGEFLWRRKLELFP